MKNISLFCILFLSGSLSVNAQEPEFARKYEHQLAINATNFIQTLISFNGSTFNNTPYDFQYKFLNWMGENKYAIGLRAGYGYRKFDFHQDLPNSNSSSNSNSILLDTRVGAEYQYSLGKRWTFFAGADFIYGKTKLYSSSKSVNFNNQVFTSETDDYRERFGLGPVIGIQFNFSKRLALGTELSMYTIQEKAWRKSSNSNSPNFNQFIYTKSQSTLVQVPSFIYFIVRL